MMMMMMMEAAKRCVEFLSMKTHFYLAFLLRVALIFYGEYQDAHFEVKFTDVDYRVFTDAARHVRFGRSPFDRHTYRYTPFLAWILVPNVTVSPLWGKLLFSAVDSCVGCVIYAFVRKFFRHFPRVELQSRLAAFFWLYNPLVFVVTARGNAESIVVLLVLVSLYLFHEGVYVLAGLVFGAAVHVKIYPIIYSLAFYLAMSKHKGVYSLVEVNAARARFAVGALISLLPLTYIGYRLYGRAFIDEAYLYHLGRKDIRHNFSPYFYMLYLTVDEEDIGINLLTFVPQVVLLGCLAKQFANSRDMPFCLFCQTVVFVTFNKVITSQYFLWYLCLFPLSLPQLRLGFGEGVICMLLWLTPQGFWLLTAYYLEFQGWNTFMVVWFQGLAFFTANVGLLAKFIRKYREVSCLVERKCDVNKVD